jgi:hypothetical protein
MVLDRIEFSACPEALRSHRECLAFGETVSQKRTYLDFEPGGAPLSNPVNLIHPAD